MRILFLTGEFPPMQGGVGDCTNEIAKGLAALGVEVQVLTSTSARDEFGIQDSKFKVQPIISKWNWSSLRAIAAACREFQPDIVHIQYQTGAYGLHPAINFAPRLLRKPNTKFVTTFHDLRVPYLFPKASPLRDGVTRALAKSCNAVIATNDEDYEKLLAFDLKLLTLIPIGSNIPTMPPTGYDRARWRRMLGVHDSETLLCYFGFLNESKGGDTLVEACALIPNAKLLMIGGQTGASDPTNVPHLARVKALITQFDLTQRVIWTDHVPPEIVSAHFDAADVCVLPYRDGASYRRGTLMAALAHGNVIVTTVASRQSPVNSNRLPQLSDSENCLLVAPDDPQAIANAVQRLTASPDLRARIGAGARELAKAFTWDKIAQQHLELYRQITHHAIRNT